MGRRYGMVDPLWLPDGVGLIPGSAFDAYAVDSRWGPHVTLQAGVVHLGRYWTTTTRHSLKANAVRAHGWASVAIGDLARCRVLGGRSQVIDPARPWSVAGTPVTGALAGGAVLRLGAGQLDQLIGYLEAGRGVPGSFMPWGRVILATELEDELVLEDGAVVGSRGRWTGGAGHLQPGRRERMWTPLDAVTELPAGVRGLASVDGDCWLGLMASTGAVAVPGSWDAGSGKVHLGRELLGALGVQLPAPVCVTLHESASRRPDRKLGLMVRGTADLVRVNATSVEVAVRPERLTFWEGFASGTVAVSA